MTDSKLDPLLRAALSAEPEELSGSSGLSEGYDPSQKLWEVIIRFTGSFDAILSQVQTVSAAELLEGYGVLTLSRSSLALLSALPQVTYIEKPKPLFFESFSARNASCVNSLQNSFPSAFTGRDVLVAIIDSGIDYTHPDFIDDNGKSRILALWDQTIPSDTAQGTFPPTGYSLGTLYDNDLLNMALASDFPRSVCPSIDLSGHGTHVAGIAAGNGRASGGLYRGVAYHSALLVVKLRSPDPSGFPSTSQLMMAVDFCIRFSIQRNQPLVVNLSFGNSYGSHSGNSLLETYLDQVSQLGKVSIVAGTGNEGASSGHVSGLIAASQSIQHEFSIGPFQPSLNIQIWQNYWDQLLFTLLSPNGKSIRIPQVPGAWRFDLEGTSLYIYAGLPSPYSIFQETYIEFLPSRSFSATTNSFSGPTPGIWILEVLGQKVIDGSYQLWMPSGSTRTPDTRFLNPSTGLTLTIPSTARRVISVGAYDSRRLQPADFSGRGYTWSNVRIKPELAAPGVDIISCAPEGGYETRSGTSMAAPFVTGGCACLMQWGIIAGNDPFLYGDKLKSYLIKGTRSLNSNFLYPNIEIGYGTFCLRNSIDI